MLDDFKIPVHMKIATVVRNMWRIALDFFMVSILRMRRFTITTGPDNYNISYQCYGYVCQVDITITVDP